MPEVLQADPRESGVGGHAAEVAALDVPLVQRLTVRLAKHESSVFVFLPERPFRRCWSFQCCRNASTRIGGMIQHAVDGS